jgi:hypothetical protein
VQSYRFAIVANDLGVPPLSSMQNVNVSITVIDVNEFSPVFTNAVGYTCTLAENTDIGTSCVTSNEIGQLVAITATDGDLAGNTVTLQLIGSGPISLNTSTATSPTRTLGDLITSAALDFELAESYVFRLRATDSGTPSRATEVTVNVTVTDVNDNSPDLGAARCVHGCDLHSSHIQFCVFSPAVDACGAFDLRSHHLLIVIWGCQVHPIIARERRF